MAKRRPRPAKPPPAEPTLTPTALIAQALAAAGLPPRPEGPGVRHFRLNGPEAEEAEGLHDPRKREFGYVPLMERPTPMLEEKLKGTNPKNASRRQR